MFQESFQNVRAQRTDDALSQITVNKLEFSLEFHSSSDRYEKALLK